MIRSKFPPLTQSIYSCDQIAEHFGLTGNLVRELCLNGQIPWCEKRKHIWIISRRGARFIAEHLRRFGDLRAAANEMREAAGRLDPRVLERQPEPVEGRLLSAEQVQDIRQRVKGGESLDSVGATYGRKKSAISRIARGLRYVGA